MCVFNKDCAFSPFEIQFLLWIENLIAYQNLTKVVFFLRFADEL